MKNVIETLIYVIVICSVVLFLFGDTENKEFNPSKEYCSMWKVWHDSDGEYGWPDKDNNYSRGCDDKN